jgi:hypothetical protein
MTPALYNQMQNQSLNMASALGHLRGTILSEMLYNDDITPSKFRHLYEAFKYSYELGGNTMDEFDISRIQKRAKEIGAVI